MIKGLKSAHLGFSTEKWRPGEQKRTACGGKGWKQVGFEGFTRYPDLHLYPFQGCSSDLREGSDLFQWLHFFCGSLGTDFWKVLENLSKTQIKDISTGSSMYCHKPSQVRIIFCHSRPSSSAFSELRNLVFLHGARQSWPSSCHFLWSVLFHWEGSAVLLQQGTTALQRFRIIFTSLLSSSYRERRGNLWKFSQTKRQNPYQLLVTIWFIFILHTILVQFFCSDNWERW